MHPPAAASLCLEMGSPPNLHAREERGAQRSKASESRAFLMSSPKPATTATLCENAFRRRLVQSVLWDTGNPNTIGMTFAGEDVKKRCWLDLDNSRSNSVASRSLCMLCPEVGTCPKVWAKELSTKRGSGGHQQGTSTAEVYCVSTISFVRTKLTMQDML